MRSSTGADGGVRVPGDRDTFGVRGSRALPKTVGRERIILLWCLALTASTLIYGGVYLRGTLAPEEEAAICRAERREHTVTVRAETELVRSTVFAEGKWLLFAEDGERVGAGAVLACRYGAEGERRAAIFERARLRDAQGEGVASPDVRKLVNELSAALAERDHASAGAAAWLLHRTLLKNTPPMPTPASPSEERLIRSGQSGVFFSSAREGVCGELVTSSVWRLRVKLAEALPVGQRVTLRFSGTETEAEVSGISGETTIFTCRNALRETGGRNIIEAELVLDTAEGFVLPAECLFADEEGDYVVRDTLVGEALRVTIMERDADTVFVQSDALRDGMRLKRGRGLP